MGVTLRGWHLECHLEWVPMSASASEVPLRGFI